MAEAEDIHIEGRGLHRSFQIGRKTIEVLRGVDLRVRRGERLFLCGASGAGKTSLLYTLAGLERPDRGEVLVGGDSLYGRPAREQARIRNRLMGYVFQSYFLLPELTALENVMLPSLIGGERAPERARALLDRVGLGDRAQHLPAELSGGEQQRVAIARALVNDPEIVFADEPTGNLDSRSGAAVMEVLLGMVGEARRTLVVVTHDRELALSGDRALILADGKLVN
jgi:putative ABC transport system ATP-binding protein/lipoprotein-releasing system ATP-binding protein